MKVFGLIGKKRQAEKEIAAGVDAIIAQGYDAAGHTGPIGTFKLELPGGDGSDCPPAPLVP